MAQVTNKDVARQAGVSIATVSRVINNLPHVRPSVRRRVQRAVKTLHYQPSRTAQRLRAPHSRVLGLIISDIQNPFFTSVVRGIEDVAYDHGYSLVLCNSDEDPEKERLYIDVMRAEAVAGVILAPTAEKNPHIQTLVEQGIPAVGIDRRIRHRRVDSVVVTNALGACQAVEHLLQLGHRRIGLVGMSCIPTGRERQAGYVQAHQKYGVRVAPELVQLGVAKPQGGYLCTQKLLDLRLRPTALFINNNMMMLGALMAIRESGLTIPVDISIVGFDDLAWASLLQPPLTTVSQPTYELGKTAAELLLERLRRPEKPVSQVQLETKLIIRGSTAEPQA
jgi:DNA-binding LacI/PurR family transcriptional regulator